MSMRDLHGYAAPEREPTRLGYRGLDVWGMGPPSSGGSTVGEALNILEGYPLATETRERQLHLFLEASRFSFADRGAYLGDPDYVDVPLRGLLSDGFAAARRALITETAATSPVAAGDPWPFNGSLGTLLAAAATDVEPTSTTHISTSDRSGNVVSYTFTIESTGGAGLVVPGWGFLLNNELTDFDFGSLTLPNRVEGGKRPRSSMAPTIVTQAGRPLLTVGSRGRLDHHHDRPAAARRPARRRDDAAAVDRRPASDAAKHDDDAGRATVPLLAGRGGARGTRSRLRHQPGDRRGDRDRVPPWRRRGRCGGADPPRRRQRDGGGSGRLAGPGQRIRRESGQVTVCCFVPFAPGSCYGHERRPNGTSRRNGASRPSTQTSSGTQPRRASRKPNGKPVYLPTVPR